MRYISLLKKALKRDTGARALRSVTEDFMLDLMYELPDQKTGKKYVITADVIDGKVSLFDEATVSKKETA